MQRRRRMTMVRGIPPRGAIAALLLAAAIGLLPAEMGRMSAASASQGTRRNALPMVAFPPAPPPVGQSVVLPVWPAVSSPLMAPLVSHLFEPFYAPLSKRLLERSLTPALRLEIEVYRQTRLNLLEELRDHLAGPGANGPDERRRQVEGVAAMQAPRLAALEARAEALRVALIEGRAGTGDDWNSHRRWRLGVGQLAGPREEVLAFEMQVMRAAAFYQEGLSPAQRWLVREMAMDLEAEAFRTDLPVGSKRSWFRFSPCTVPVALTVVAWPELEELIDDYRFEKEALKADLREALYDQDRVRSAAARVATLRELAARQASRIAALEDKAEAIRREIASRDAIRRRPLPAPVPAQLSERIDAFIKLRAGIEAEKRTFANRVRRERAAGRPGDPEQYVDWENETRRLIREADQQYRLENTDRFARLIDLLEELRREIAAYAGRDASVGRGIHSDSFVDEFLDDQRLSRAGSEYSIAVFEPGLSPVQRRLLVGAALERTRLPLPPPEPMPSVLPGTLAR